MTAWCFNNDQLRTALDEWSHAPEGDHVPTEDEAAFLQQAVIEFLHSEQARKFRIDEKGEPKQ